MITYNVVSYLCSYPHNDISIYMYFLFLGLFYLVSIYFYKKSVRKYDGLRRVKSVTNWRPIQEIVRVEGSREVSDRLMISDREFFIVLVPTLLQRARANGGPVALRWK